jgi:hypothetical protein
MIRFAIVALVLAAALYGVREERLLEDAGLFGSCDAVATSVGSEGQWLACRAGQLTDFPDLSRDACTRTGRRGALEYWRCPAPLVASRAADEPRRP